MALPTNKINKNSEGEVIVSALKSIKRAVTRAESLDNEAIINLHYSAKKFVSYMLNLQSAGLTIPILGTILESQLGIVWNDHKAEFISFVATHLPAYSDYCKVNEVEILAKTLGTSNAEYVAISTPTKAQLSTLIDNIKALYP
ncbi:MAG: hypothetical protein JKY81_04615 [Colwellia sp.]|nr:hypothetical protein [Colwellia sp.]